MDYGKLAYLKTQDLSEQMNNMRLEIETAPYNCLSLLDKRPYYFSKDLEIQGYSITAKRLNVIDIQYKVLIKSLMSTSLDFTIYVNNVKAETFTDYINGETKSFIFKTVVNCAILGENILSALIQFESASEYVVLCTEINVMGSNITETVKDRQVDTIDKFSGFYIASSNKKDNYIDLINQNIDAKYVSSPYNKLEKKGSTYLINKINLLYQENIVDLDFYAYVDADKNLVINLYSLINNVIYDTKVVDKHVTKITACPNFHPMGLSLSYIKDHEIYTSNITAEPFSIYFTPPKKLKTSFGRIKEIFLFLNNDMAALCFINESNNGYLKLSDGNNMHLEDFSAMFFENTISLGKCENCRFKILRDKIILLFKQKNAVYKKTIENNMLLQGVELAAFCDELIPVKDIFIMRKNGRLNILSD